MGRRVRAALLRRPLDPSSCAWHFGARLISRAGSGGSTREPFACRERVERGRGARLARTASCPGKVGTPLRAIKPDPGRCLHRARQILSRCAPGGPLRWRERARALPGIVAPAPRRPQGCRTRASGRLPPITCPNLDPAPRPQVCLRQRRPPPAPAHRSSASPWRCSRRPPRPAAPASRGRCARRAPASSARPAGREAAPAPARAVERGLACRRSSTGRAWTAWWLACTRSRAAPRAPRPPRVGRSVA